jgi:hypothetical protein
LIPGSITNAQIWIEVLDFFVDTSPVITTYTSQANEPVLGKAFNEHTDERNAVEMSITPQKQHESSSMEKTDTDSVLPAADTGEAFQLTEKKSPAEVQQSGEDEMSLEKARFSELREGLAPWRWGLFHAVCFFGGAISGTLFQFCQVRYPSWAVSCYRLSSRK